MATGWVKTFYKSTVWKHKRREVLRRDNYECQKHKRKGLYARAETVHHIKHLRGRPDLALIDGNLISVCNSCHCELHPEKLKPVNPKKKFKNVERW